jgi:ABC-type transport system involved in multi-copper enzyme maturation permease subunit
MTESTMPVVTGARARLRAYGRWQLRDYFVERGAPTSVVIGLLGWLLVAPMMSRLGARLDNVSAGAIVKYGSRAAAQHAMLLDMSAEALSSSLGAIVFVGALFAMNGIVANDRKQGFYRFLFAKPVSPPAYYGQAFVLHGLGFLSIIAAMSLVYGALVTPVLDASLLAAVGATYLCYAGLAFALSAAARWDWLSLVSVSVAATYVWDRFGQSSSPAAWLAYLFPPLHRASEVYNAAGGGVALPWHLVLWFAGYGAICFVIGLVVLRYRRLAII